MQKKNILKIFRKCLLLFVVLYAIDFVIGNLLEKTFYKQTHGDDYVTIYSLDSTKEDILIFGTSRASHHYKTRLLQNLTNYTYYNCGRDEMTIFYSQSLINSILKRYNPKLIILDILPTELNYNKSSNLNYERIVNTLKPFVQKHPELKESISKSGKLEILKTDFSRIYPFNSLIGSIVQNTYTNLGHKQELGYEPLWNKIDSLNYGNPIWGNSMDTTAVDDILVTQLKQIINLTKQHNVRLITIVSPFYFKLPIYKSTSYQTFKKVLTNESLQFLDFSQDTDFLSKPFLFNDDVHLNDSGANIFSKKIATICTQVLNNP
jgi:hypothetical protein